MRCSVLHQARLIGMATFQEQEMHKVMRQFSFAVWVSTFPQWLQLRSKSGVCAHPNVAMGGKRRIYFNSRGSEQNKIRLFFSTLCNLPVVCEMPFSQLKSAKSAAYSIFSELSHVGSACVSFLGAQSVKTLHTATFSDLNQWVLCLISAVIWL